MAGTRALPRASGRQWRPKPVRRHREGASLRGWLQHRLWIPPVAGAVLGACLGIIFVKPPPLVAAMLRGVAWQGTAAEARSMLSAVLGVALTSLSIVLSLTMLVVQNAAGQYSPRLLRLYLHGAGIRVVIPLFVATSVFCLVAAQAFGFVPELERAPRPALALAMLLLVVCEGTLVFQVLQTLQLMRVENLVKQVRQRALTTAWMLERFRSTDVEPSPPLRARTRDAGKDWPLRAPRNGFIVSVDAGALLKVATAHPLVVHLERAVGEPVVQGEEVGWFEARPRGPTEALVWRAIHLGGWRSTDRDVALGVRQLVDVAIKALSPGINDPYTAVEALDQLTFLLSELSGMNLGPRVLADESGTPRVFLHGPALRDFLALATDQILRYGAAEPAVTLRLLRLAAAVGLRAREAEDRHAARELLRDILAVAEQARPEAPRDSLLRGHAEALEQALDGGPWPPLPAIGF
ncbi:DUF2254 domain-containing protein [Corallococcus exiguus]|uniref:DUF2254 domain-containing protein n=1 Tax=Corallococcus exiguus TaxID=83462 RepID=A0A7X4Y8M7_9BACT|nr:DUF2254 domain-containing protein [Corallococcus exiguus]NBC40928.1 DUF2254 domain-containing protein [Corallococcus exiguus]TNV64856.1 DUF2254 domain-containing protein [Corallococcus exiguus]